MPSNQHRVADDFSRQHLQFARGDDGDSGTGLRRGASRAGHRHVHAWLVLALPALQPWGGGGARRDAETVQAATPGVLAAAARDRGGDLGPRPVDVPD
jgi:hypothetical protein